MKFVTKALMQSLVLLGPLLPAYSQHELGGLEKVRLHVSSFLIRNQTSPAVPRFDFQNGADTWDGDELKTTTETTSVTDWAAVDSCAQAALRQANSDCYYLDSVEYICGQDSWGFNIYCSRSVWRYNSTCGQSSQQAIIDAIESGTHPCVTSNTFDYPLARNDHYVRVSPGETYTLEVSSAGGVLLETAFLAPAGYLVYIKDGTGQFRPSSRQRVDFQADSKTIEFQIREEQARSPGLIGQAGNLLVGDLRWELGLGTLGNGDSAGRLVFHEADLADETYTRAAIKYYEPISAGLSEIDIVRDADGHLRQIKTPGAFVDLVDVATSGGKVIRYEIRYYSPLAPGTAAGASGLYSTGGLSMLSKYSFGRDASQGLTHFSIKQFDSSGSLLREDAVTKQANGSTSAGVPLNHWLVVTTANSGSAGVSKSILVQNFAHTENGTATGLRSQVVRYGQQQRGYAEEGHNFFTQTVYQLIPDIGAGEVGEVKVYEGRFDTTAQNGKGYNYFYLLDANAPQSYGQRYLSVDAWGGWKFINYNGAEHSLDYGEADLLLEPGDVPYDPIRFLSGSDWETELTGPNDYARYITTARVSDFDGLSRREAVITRGKNTGGLSSLVPIAQQVNQPTFIEVSGESIEVVCNYLAHDFPGASNRRNASYTARYAPDTANPRLIYKPYFTFAADKSKSSYGYFEGSYRGVSNAFVTLQVNGYHTDSLAYSDTEEGNEGNQTHGVTTHAHSGLSFSVDEVLLLPGKSTKELTVRDARGNVRFIESWVYNTSSQWVKTGDLVQTFTDYGQLTSITQNGRVIYEAEWNGIRKRWEKDETGLQILYEYDGIGRVVKKTVVGTAGVDGIPASREMRYYYDARDRLIVTETVVNGNDTLVEKTIYDAEGYIISETDQNGLTTTHSYSAVNTPEFIGMKRTSHFPDTTYKETYTKQNGELWKEVLCRADGTVLNEDVYTYSDNVAAPPGSGLTGTNRKVRIDHYGSTGGAGSHPYEEKYLDASGMVCFEQSPTSIANSYFQRKFVYNGKGQQIRTVETEVSGDGTSASLSLTAIREYDEMGTPKRSGVDMDGDGSLTLASADRIVDETTQFVSADGGQWSRTTTVLYPEENQATAISSVSRTKLTGLAATQISVVETIDVHGSKTTETTTVDRGAATVTTAKYFPDSTTSMRVTVNGLLKSQSNRQGHTSRFSYDGAGRLTGTTDARGISEIIERFPGSNRVAVLRKDVSPGNPGGYVTSFTYHPGGTPGAGMIASETNAGGKSLYRTYNARGSITRQWGAATQPQLLEYDAFGRLWKQHTFRSDETSGSDFSQPTWPGGASGDVTTFGYDDATGLLLSRTDAASRVTSFTYDQRGQLRTRVTPSSPADTANNIAATTAVTTTHTYHPKTGERTSTSYNDGGITPDLGFTYHRNGSLKSVTDGAGTRTFHYDFSPNGGTTLKLVQESLPGAYRNVADLAGNDTGHTIDAITYQYQHSNGAGSIRGRLSGYSMGLRGGTAGVLAATRYQNAYSFTADNRLGYVSLKAGAGATLGRVDYAYVPGTQFVGTRSVHGGSLAETREFNPSRDTLASIGTSAGGTVLTRHSYSYDALGRREHIVQSGSQFAPYGGQLYTRLGYDSRNGLTSYGVYQGGGAGGKAVPGRSVGWSYDTCGNRLSETRKGVRLKGNAGYQPVDQTFGYGTNALNQYTFRLVPDWTEISGVTGERHLVTAVQGTGANIRGDRAQRMHRFFHLYARLRESGEGNAVATQIALYTVDPGAGSFDAGAGANRDRIKVEQLKVRLQQNAENFVYDARGNLVEDGWFSYTWDAENRLVGVEHKSGVKALAGSGVLDLVPVKLRFRYDHLGRRYSKESYPWAGSGFSARPDKQTLFYYDGWNLLGEACYNVAYSGSTLSSASLAEDKHYYWGLDWSGSLSGAGGVGGLVAFSRRNAGEPFTTLAYPSFDGTGNVMGLYKADGTMLAQYEYSPYGKILREEGDWAAANPFRFQTKQYDDETGLTYYQSRYYSASLGRFLSQDPLGTEGGLNLYSFVNNNPLNAYDFLGLYGVSDFFGGLGSAVGGFSGRQAGFGTTCFPPRLTFSTPTQSNRPMILRSA